VLERGAGLKELVVASECAVPVAVAEGVVVHDAAAGTGEAAEHDAQAEIAGKCKGLGGEMVEGVVVCLRRASGLRPPPSSSSFSMVHRHLHTGADEDQHGRSQTELEPLSSKRWTWPEYPEYNQGPHISHNQFV
jgi:hypothetical protein